jgi:hypothetical protein
MQKTVLGRALLVGAQEVDVSATAAKSDAGADGELRFYRSGSTIIMQIYDASAAAWRAVTLS